jgi:hypothetical protein
MEQAILTEHARMRLGARRIPEAAVDAAFLYGRERHMKGATYFVIGRKEVVRHRAAGVDLGEFEGIQIVCAGSAVVMTAYRNRDLSGLRPHGSRWNRRGRRAGRSGGCLGEAAT